MRRGSIFAAFLLACSVGAMQGCAGRTTSGGAALVPMATPAALAVRRGADAAAVGPITPITPLKLSLPTNVWSWVNVPQSTCDDGSTTGIGVNPGTGPDLVVFFD